MKLSLLYMVIGVIAILVSIARQQVTLLNLIYQSARWQEMADGVAIVMVIYGFLFILLAVVNQFLAMRKINLHREVITRLYESSQELLHNSANSINNSLMLRKEVEWLLIILLVGTATRAYFLAQPMRYDEAFTFTNFVNRGVWDLFYYPLPNNHVFHTLLVKSATIIYGPHPAAIRLPAFLAGIATIPLTFWICRRIVNEKAGIVAALAMAVFPYMILYSTTARGYSLLVFLVLALTLVGLELSKKLSLSGCVLFSVIASLGMWTMPTMLFAIAGVYFWLTCLFVFQKNSIQTILYKFLLPSGIFLFIFTLLFYTPTIVASNGVRSIVANPYVQSSPWDDFFKQIALHSREIQADFLRDVPAVILFPCLILITIGTLGAVRTRNFALSLLLPAMFIGAGAVFIAKQSIPYTRTWIFLLPFVFILVDAGVTYSTEWLLHRRRALVTLFSLMLAVAYAIFLVSKNAIAQYPDTGLFPEAAVIVDFLKPMLKSNDAIFVAVPADDPMMFYLWYATANSRETTATHYFFDGGSRQPSGRYQNKITAISGEDTPEMNYEYFVVQKGEYTISDMTKEPVVKLLELSGVAVYQRIASEESKSVLQKATK